MMLLDAASGGDERSGRSLRLSNRWRMADMAGAKRWRTLAHIDRRASAHADGSGALRMATISRPRPLLTMRDASVQICRANERGEYSLAQILAADKADVDRLAVMAKCKA